MRAYATSDDSEQPTSDSLARQEFRSEWELESFLHANPGALLDGTVLVFGRQVPTDVGEPDLLALDRHGNVIVFELKRGKSGTKSASEETILAQPQTYAGELSTYDYEELDAIYQDYRRYCKENGWPIADATHQTDDLKAAFDAIFGSSLTPSAFNRDQRMVIVAEQVTNRTRTNARYLRDQGVNMQCVEVQRFTNHRTGEAVVVANTVVNYDSTRVRQGHQEHPAYPYIVEDIIDRAFPDIQPIMEADAPETVIRDIRSPRPYLQSTAPGHPEDLRYTLYLRPEEWGNVVLGIDYWGDDEQVPAQLKQHEPKFTSQGFAVRDGNTTERIVRRTWPTESRDKLENEDFRADVADAVVDLVETTHSIFWAE